MFIRQPRSPASNVPAPVAATAAHLSVTMRSEMSGYLTQKVPPKPQQTSAPASSRSSSPRHEASSRRGCCLDRKGVVAGTSVSVRVDVGGRRNIKKKKKQT